LGNMGNYLQIALGKIIGTKNERELKRLGERIHAVNALEPEMQKLSDSASPLSPSPTTRAGTHSEPGL